MPEDEFDARPEDIFDRIKLSADDAARMQRALARPRDLRTLVGEVVFFSTCLAGRSRRIDDAARQGMRLHIDETKLLIAALPALDESALFSKLAALDDREPLVADNGNFRTMLEAGARADIARLQISNPPSWMLEWALS